MDPSRDDLLDACEFLSGVVSNAHRQADRVADFLSHRKDLRDWCTSSDQSTALVHQVLRKLDTSLQLQGLEEAGAAELPGYDFPSSDEILNEAVALAQGKPERIPNDQVATKLLAWQWRNGSWIDLQDHGLVLHPAIIEDPEVFLNQVAELLLQTHEN
jgi:hypothetical protein